MKASKKIPSVMQLIRECDENAARFWRQEARSKELGYKEWLKSVKKAADFIRVLKK